MFINLDRHNARPLYQQLVHNIQQRIRSGALPSGAQLPTVRELARQLGVTRLTIHTAYSELAAGGWVEATVGRGTFVSARSEPAEINTSGLGQEFSPHGIITDMMRMSQLPGMRSLAMADAAAELYPQREFGRALEEALAADGTAALGYTSSQGEPTLRTTLADLLHERGISAGPDEIVITSGVTQAIALVARTLASPGDTVVVEHPTYLGAFNILNGQGLRVVGVPMDEHGMQVDALEQIIQTQRPRFIYTIPIFHNPSGVCMTPERRAALMALAERHRIPIVEDDVYSQIAFAPPIAPPLKANDPLGLVVHCSSFSKSLLPGLRIGYLAAAPQIVERIVVAKQADDLCSPPLLQRALALFIERGAFAAHLRRATPHYQLRRDALVTAMARYFPSDVRWTVPSGGFCSWVALPNGASATELYLAAIEQGVAFAPGDFFFAGPAPRPFLRLAYSTQPPDVIDEVVGVIGTLLSDHLRRRAIARPSRASYPPLV